jgi:transcription antitermination factor NusG
MNLERQDFSQINQRDYLLNNMEQFRWYAVRVRNQQESMASQSLKSRGLEEFHPVYTVRRRWADRIKVIELPLFAGYVFCRFIVGQKSLVLASAGRINIVKFGANLAPVPDEDIAALKLIAKSGLASPCPYINEGRRVRICTGAFKNVEGYIQKVKNEEQLIISLHLLQRSVSVHIGADAVQVV